MAAKLLKKNRFYTITPDFDDTVRIEFGYTTELNDVVATMTFKNLTIKLRKREIAKLTLHRDALRLLTSMKDVFKELTKHDTTLTQNQFITILSEFNFIKKLLE